MKEIPLTQGKVALVDDDMYEELVQYKWQVQQGSNTFYACRVNSRRLDHATIGMHRQIVNAPKGIQVDHINGNGLDNRRENLRLCNHQQNHFNMIPQKKGTSGFKGVCWNKNANRWRAQIMHNGKGFYLGYFEDEVEAARAYDVRAQELFGEFARLNFPTEQP